MPESQAGPVTQSGRDPDHGLHYEARSEYGGAASRPASASDLLDSHVLGNDKLAEPAMERSTRFSIDGNSVDILLPYLKLLTIMGLRPVLDVSNSSKCAICCSHFHSIQVAILMFVGYILQYMACFSSYEIRMALKVLLIICTLIHDMVQATIITSYCLQAQLLQAHLMFLKERLLNRTITPLNWMREIAEFRKLLKYLNDDLAPAVCLFTIVNISWATSGIMWLLNLDKVDTETEPLVGISILNELIWISAVIVPFVQAARLSKECRRTQSVGHELCVRPFLHQDTSQEDITSVLMYASTLRLHAKLFHYPIAGRYLCLVLTITVIVLFSLGMCHLLQ
ncbi:unnamed protein product [Spodoptera exigua]|nr:unnamed protein product [Spodoptera exigua]